MGPATIALHWYLSMQSNVSYILWTVSYKILFAVPYFCSGVLGTLMYLSVGNDDWWLIWGTFARLNNRQLLYWIRIICFCFCGILASPSEVSQRGRSTSVAQISSNRLVVRSWSYPVRESSIVYHPTILEFWFKSHVWQKQVFAGRNPTLCKDILYLKVLDFTYLK